ncbi:MAG: YraN family protein [Fimbriimonas sp.]
MKNKVDRGRRAEAEAADYLLAKGYTLITRRFKARHGEIDLVCLDGETLIFVEVRARYGQDGLPEASVGTSKLAAMQNAARQYISETGTTRDVRFDLIAIDQSGLRHHRGLEL